MMEIGSYKEEDDNDEDTLFEVYDLTLNDLADLDAIIIESLGKSLEIDEDRFTDLSDKINTVLKDYS